MIYLDYNATAPMRPEVVSRMQEIMAQPYNASSVHALGRKAKRILEDGRQLLAERVSCFPAEVVFTASGSEANNMVLRGFQDRPIFVAASEHVSVIETAKRLGGDILPVTSQGLVDMDALESKLRHLGRPALVSVMLANNETGVIQPIREIAALVHHYDSLLHTDAVQMLGKRPVDIGLLGADMMTLSAHKMGGPVGVGALIVREGITLPPMLTGGNQELGRRASTENIAAIAGFASALESAHSAEDWTSRVGEKMKDIKRRIHQEFPTVIIAGEEVERLTHVLSILLPGVTSEAQLMHLDLAGICVSAGSACSSGRIAPSHVLHAMGFSEAVASSVIRVSAGWKTTDAELDAFYECWSEMAQRLQKKAA